MPQNSAKHSPISLDHWYKGLRSHHHHHHVRLFKTMTKRIVTLDKKVNESIGPFKKHTGDKIAVIIITRFSSKCQIVSTSSKVID